MKYRYDNEQIEHHCRYYSGSYTEAQLKWEINRKELFALCKCLLAFEPYIVYNEFIVRTDNTQLNGRSLENYRIQSQLKKYEEWY